MVNATDWPDPASVIVGPGHKIYTTPDGERYGTTRILKVLGLSTEGLIKWSANEERKACLEAAHDVYADVLSDTFICGGAREFINAVETKIGSARQHQRQLQKGGEIGTAVHQAIHQHLRDPKVEQPPMLEPAWRAFQAFQAWWKETDLKEVRMEQPVWDKEYAGTIDLIAEHPVNGLGIVDFKTSKGIYDDHHLQVAAYLHAARNFADVKWAQIVRLPKNVDDPGFEMKPLGALYDRQLTQDQLMQAFFGALAAYKILVVKP